MIDPLCGTSVQQVRVLGLFQPSLHTLLSLGSTDWMLSGLYESQGAPTVSGCWGEAGQTAGAHGREFFLASQEGVLNAGMAGLRLAFYA